MRTYLPYASFQQCAECFTLKRLTKQRHDVMEILYLLSGRNHPSRGDRFMYNSPPKKVWQHCPFTLIQYGLALCDEYEKRRDGKPDPIRERLLERQQWFRQQRGEPCNERRPDFLDSEQMHNSHRAILARQDEQHYEQYGFEREPEDEKVFYWPVEEAARQYDPDELRRDRERERERRRREEEQERRSREGDEFEDDDSGDSEDDVAPDDPFDDWSVPQSADERLGRGGASLTGRMPPVNDDGECECHACRAAREAEAREANRGHRAAASQVWGSPDFAVFEQALAPSDIREVAAALQAMTRNDQLRAMYGGDSPWTALTGEQQR
jgi:Pyrimidine dimer DNA glycosylase